MPPAPWRLGACEKFLSYYGAEVDARGLFLVQFPDQGERVTGLDQVDVEVRVDEVFGH